MEVAPRYELLTLILPPLPSAYTTYIAYTTCSAYTAYTVYRVAKRLDCHRRCSKG